MSALKTHHPDMNDPNPKQDVYLSPNVASEALGLAMVPILKHIPPWMWLTALTSLLLKLAGSIPSSSWEYFDAPVEPCEKPSCRCHEDQAAVQKLLKDFRRTSLARQAAKKQPHG